MASVRRREEEAGASQLARIFAATFARLDHRHFPTTTVPGHQLTGATMPVAIEAPTRAKPWCLSCSCSLWVALVGRTPLPPDANGSDWDPSRLCSEYPRDGADPDLHLGQYGLQRNGGRNEQPLILPRQSRFHGPAKDSGMTQAVPVVEL
eukprot:scaffold269_cov404-Prasinococcus_capsulatus_cf.AAC.44